MGLNFSEIINQGIAAIAGVEYGEKQELIRQKSLQMRDKIRRRFIEEKAALEEEFAEREAKRQQEEAEANAADVRAQQISSAVSKILKGGALQTAYRRLPVFDKYGDHIDYWQELAASVSRAAGFTVDESQVQDYVRKHGGNRSE